MPFPKLIAPFQTSEVTRLAQTLEAAAKQAGFAYVSLGPALPQFEASYAVIPEALAATSSVFFGGSMTVPGAVSLPAVRACAKIIHAAAPLSPDGFANLRFAALANVQPGSPFFPAAYHDGGAPVFALAVEAADLAVTAFSESEGMEAARRSLQNAVETHAARLEVAARPLAQQFGVRFGGIDFSLAPFPSQAQSLGAAFERMGAPAVGLHGSLAAAAALADTLDRARFPRVGFSGLFLPVLEDATLAARAADGSLTVNDLLLYSAVCGAGLDTIPLPGDTTVEALNAVLLDVAALAVRLGKPLTARLMPIPGKKVGDPTGFDFAFFANSRVMGLRAAPLHGALAGNELLPLTPHSAR